MAQLAYNTNMGVGIPGLKKDSRFDLVTSRLATETIPFGYGFKYESTISNVGMGDGIAVELIESSTDKLDGIALFTQAKEVGQYVDKDVISSLRRGACWVVINSGATLNSIVYGASAYLAAGGTFTNIEEPGNCVGIFKSGVVAYSSTVNIALLEIDLEGVTLILPSL